MGYEIENTLSSFKKAVEVGAGIETDLQLTKDDKLLCLHDATFKIDSKWYNAKDLTFDELKALKFGDNRELTLIEDVFNHFSENNDNLMYSCDIGSKQAGFKLIDLVKKRSLLKNVEITDLNIYVLKALREYDKNIKLIHTIPHSISKVSEKTVKFQKARDIGIEILNLKYERANQDNFRAIIENGFKCYVWGVNAKFRMKKTLALQHKNQNVEGIYTDYPDILIKMRDDF